MVYCLVPGCTSGGRKKEEDAGKIIFHVLPSDERRAAEWIQATKRENLLDSKKGCVCSKHFVPEDYERDLKFELLNPGIDSLLNKKRKLKDSAVPSQNIPKKICMARRGSGANTVLKERREAVDEVLAAAFTAEMECPEPGPSSISPSEAKDLRKRIAELENALRLQTEETARKTREIESYRKGLQHLFTDQQIDCLVNATRPYPWNEETVLKALSLRTHLSRTQYEYLRTIGFPLPGFSTLLKRLSSFTIRPGDATQVTRMLRLLLEDKPDTDRACLLMFDEMKVSSIATYDADLDQIMGPHNYMQQVIVRSVCGKWKLPLCFAFDQAMTKDLLDELIILVEAAGGKVVAAVSDMGGSNRGLWTELDIDHEGSTHFPNPVDESRKVWMFADTPHLLKLLRNHILDDGVTLPDGGVVDKELLTQVVSIDEGRNFKILPRVKLVSHIQVTGQARQKVRPAAQLLSSSTAKAIETFFPLRKEEAAFIQLCNDGFDVLNGHAPGDNNPLRRGLGSSSRSGTGDQLQVLADLESMLTTMKIGRRNALLPFQRGFLVTIKSMRGLVADVVERHGPSAYVLTGRITQDILESFFGMVRGKGGANFNPSPSEAKHRVRNLVLMYVMKHGLNPLSGQPTGVADASMEEDDSAMLAAADFVQEKRKGEGEEEAAADLAEIQALLRDADYHHRTPASNASPSPIDPRTGVSAEAYGMAHAAGYVAAKCRKVDPSLGSPSAHADEQAPVETMWTRLMSRGGLNVPTARWLAQFKAMEGTFCRYHYGKPDGLSRLPGVTHELQEVLREQHPTLDARVIRRFVRLRTFIRLGCLNQERRRDAKERRDARKKREFAN